MGRVSSFPSVVIFSISVLLGACAETEFAAHVAKEMRGAARDSDKTVGTYKIGDPYRIEGVWYYPKVNYTYAETGIASWYGAAFHGKRTANGNIYDMNALTAAHRTLPLPSKVRVTNLENGRTMALVINDRGPFARGRIIDVSRRVAQLLGFERKGTAKVRVGIIADESRRLAVLARQGKPWTQKPAEVKVAAVPQGAVTATPLPIPGAAASRKGALNLPALHKSPPNSGLAALLVKPVRAKALVTVEPVRTTRIYVQAGAFTYRANALRLKRWLSSFGPVDVHPAEVGPRNFFQVRLGPFKTVAEADAMLDEVITLGYTGARVVVD